MREGSFKIMSEKWSWKEAWLGVVNTQANIQLMYYITVHLKPI